MKRRLIAMVFWLCCFVPAFSQDDKKAEMADEMRRNGKIYVVVLVLVIILAGLYIYLFRLDRKINKLEKKE